MNHSVQQALPNHNKTITLLFGNKSGAGKSWCSWVLANTLLAKGIEPEDILVANCDEFKTDNKQMDYVTYHHQCLKNGDTKEFDPLILIDYIHHLVAETSQSHIIVDFGLTAINMIGQFLAHDATHMRWAKYKEMGVMINLTSVLGWHGDQDMLELLSDNADDMFRIAPEDCEKVILLNMRNEYKEEQKDLVEELASFHKASIQEVKLFQDDFEYKTSACIVMMSQTHARYDEVDIGEIIFKKQFETTVIEF